MDRSAKTYVVEIRLMLALLPALKFVLSCSSLVEK